MLSRHTAPITAPFRHPSVTESSIALPPIQREASVARSTNARFTASRGRPASLSQMPVAHGDPAYCLSTFRVRALDPAVHQVLAYPRGPGKSRPDEVRCLSAGSTATGGRHSKDDDMTELMSNDLHRHDWAARAAEALAQAKKLPPGLKRSEAIRKAAQLRIAADMKNWLTAKSQRRDAPVPSS
jgi:hypothetical protein